MSARPILTIQLHSLSGDMKAAIVGLFALVASTTALYSSKSPVIQLTASDFNKKVVKGDGVWLVEV